MSTPRTLRYYHWASQPVRLRRREYAQGGHPKPNGFWFDVNEDWKRLCAAAEFPLEGLRYRHDVAILDASRLLFLKSARDIDAFTRTYGRDVSLQVQPLQSAQALDAFADQYGQALFDDIRKAFSSYILWSEVAARHSGILVYPYSRARSQTYLWYWGWQCASGCVWDTRILRLGAPRKMEG